MSAVRKMEETTGSLIKCLLPQHIHAVTTAGFESKVALCILACGCNFAFRIRQDGNIG